MFLKHHRLPVGLSECMYALDKSTWKNKACKSLVIIILVLFCSSWSLSHWIFCLRWVSCKCITNTNSSHLFQNIKKKVHSLEGRSCWWCSQGAYARCLYFLYLDPDNQSMDQLPWISQMNQTYHSNSNNHYHYIIIYYY